MCLLIRPRQLRASLRVCVISCPQTAVLWRLVRRLIRACPLLTVGCAGARNTLQDFYSKECWAHHPPPYADFVEFTKQERAELEAERKKLVS